MGGGGGGRGGGGRRGGKPMKSKSTIVISMKLPFLSPVPFLVSAL
jgi:hypothetical protein